MDIFDAYVGLLIQLVRPIEENRIVMSAEPTLACQHMYVTKCQFKVQTQNANLKLAESKFKPAFIN